MASEALNNQPSQPTPTLRDWLFNPFIYIAGEKALLIGLGAILLTGLITFFSKSHVDGVLDFHTGLQLPFWAHLAEGVIDWLALALVLFILGKLISKTAFRPIDLFGTQAMARWPMILPAIAALLPPYQRFVVFLFKQMPQILQQGKLPNIALLDFFTFIFVIIVSMIALVWMVILMYRSFSICCNVRGTGAAFTFVGGLLIAELITKVIFIGVLLPK